MLSLILIYLTSQHCSKNAWDSSGGSQALGSIQSSLPQGTKDYIADAQNKVFNRKNLRSPTVFFGLGEEKPFYLERVPSLITERVKHNLSFFYLNYVLLTALLFCLTLLISPSAIIGIGLLGFAWMAVIRATAEGSVQIKGESNKFFFITSIHNSSIFSHPPSLPTCRNYYYSKTSNNSNGCIQCHGVDLASGTHLLVDCVNVWFLDRCSLFVAGRFNA